MPLSFPYIPSNPLAVANGGTGGTATSAASALAAAKATLLPNWRLALANVRNGTSNARILCVGDSTTEGKGSSTQNTIPAQHAWPARLAQLLTGGGVAALNSLGVPPSQYGSVDGRWSAGSNWGTQGSYFGAGGQACYKSSGTAGNLVFTSGVTADSYYVYYLGNSGLATLTLQATGGASVPVNTGSLSAGIYRTLITAASASAANTVTITATGSNGYIVGVEPFLSTASQILVGNAGVASTQTNDWVQSPATFGGINFIKTVAPNLTVISLGVNDAGASVSASTYAANIQSLITAAKASGDVLLVDFPPSSGSPYVSFEAGYVPQLQALAQSNNVLYASMYGRFGSAYNAALMYDALHPTDQGYWDWAAFIYGLIGSP